MGFWVAMTRKGSSSSWVVLPLVTVRSCMASSSADCVLGVARLISSASTRLAKMGPCWKRRDLRICATCERRRWRLSRPGARAIGGMVSSPRRRLARAVFHVVCGYATRSAFLMLSHRFNLLSAGRVYAGAPVALATICSAGAQIRQARDAAAFRSDATLVLVPVTVVDHRGAIVNGLASGAFTLTEDGVRQQVHSFSEEDAPVSMGIVLDLSGSMSGVLSPAKEALRALMKDANPADEAFLNTVSTRPREYSGFTHDFDEVLSRVAFEKAGGDTALIDTIYGSLHELRSGIHARRSEERRVGKECRSRWSPYQ